MKWSELKNLDTLSILIKLNLPKRIQNELYQWFRASNDKLPPLKRLYAEYWHETPGAKGKLIKLLKTRLSPLERLIAGIEDDV